ncbi:MAG: Ig-like domain-containing protein [Halofilum sp. (in: g-proteobacteria)]|nr:Ig-like domain-containing protein [Halofilum sp. (in: g-proteobacteria)]
MTITDSELSASDTDNTDNQRQFRIDKNVENGQLLLNNTVLSVGSVFTQQDLIDGNVEYVHDGSENLTDFDDFTVSDGGGGNEPTGTFNFEIKPINNPPTVEVPGDQSVREEQTLDLSGITIDDLDIAGDDADVILEVGKGTLSASGAASVAGDGTATVTITGTVTDINDTLTTLTYQGDTDETGADTLNVTVKDQGNNGTDPDLTGSGEMLAGRDFDGQLPDDGNSDPTFEQATASVGINIITVNDPPVVTAPVDQTINEDEPFVFSTANSSALSFADVDIGSGEAEVTLSVNNGTLAFAGATTGLTFSDNDGSAGTLVFTGTQADVNTALENGLTYSGNADFNGSDTLTMTVSDQGNTGDRGGVKTDSDSVGITVDPVNDPRKASDVSASGDEDDGAITFTLGSSSVDDGSNSTTRATVEEFRIETEPDHGTLEDSGGAVLSAGNIITVAEAITYTPDADFNGSDSFTYTPIDADGAESASPGTASLTVNAVNDAPEISGDGDTVTFTEGGGEGVLGTAVVLDDGDFTLDEDIELTETIAPNSGPEDDFASSSLTVERSGSVVATDRLGIDTTDGTLSVSGSTVTVVSTSTDIATIDATDDGDNGRLVITFNAAAGQSDVSVVMQRITYNSIDDDETGTLAINVTFDDGNAGAAQGSEGTKSATGSFNVDVTNTNDAPSLSNGAEVSAEEDNNASGTRRHAAGQ